MKGSLPVVDGCAAGVAEGCEDTEAREMIY